ncbi:hypothetical protein [Rhizobium sp. P44RR-XXIV]|uniref:DUF6950 family protein n=1 Tax=Rhizobium sp. P44RR-XXIV TaxID=1921145 RepID=UPI000984DD9E|nr:hypothetical protein [Rhizobium sp. P44RR-XXIV]TIX89184.1 hypothetical protein BSK43_021500 [Rhizobium sp. P44RR-XXIV]
MTLHEFVALPHRFRWGGLNGDDCLTFCATWIAEASGVDPAEKFRGTYCTEEQAAALIEAAGGMVAFADKHLRAAGIRRTKVPKHGDVGVILAPAGLDGATKQIGAIRFGNSLWLALGPAGIVGKKAEFVAAWSVAQ